MKKGKHGELRESRSGEIGGDCRRELEKLKKWSFELDEKI